MGRISQIPTETGPNATRVGSGEELDGSSRRECFQTSVPAELASGQQQQHRFSKLVFITKRSSPQKARTRKGCREQRGGTGEAGKRDRDRGHDQSIDEHQEFGGAKRGLYINLPWGGAGWGGVGASAEHRHLKERVFRFHQNWSNCKGGSGLVQRRAEALSSCLRLHFIYSLTPPDLIFVHHPFTKIRFLFPFCFDLFRLSLSFSLSFSSLIPSSFDFFFLVDD